MKCENLFQNALKLMQTSYISNLRNILIHLNVNAWQGGKLEERLPYVVYTLVLTFTCIGWLRQSQGPSTECRTSGERTSAIVGKCPDWKGLSVKLGGRFLLEAEAELEPDDPEEVVAILLPLSLALLLVRPPKIDWFKLPKRGFLKGLDGLVPERKYRLRNNPLEFGYITPKVYHIFL